jgi:hypothetical protein
MSGFEDLTNRAQLGFLEQTPLERLLCDLKPKPKGRSLTARLVIGVSRPAGRPQISACLFAQV